MKFRRQRSEVLCSMGAPKRVLVSIDRYQTGLPKLKPLIRVEGNRHVGRVDRHHLIMHLRVVTLPFGNSMSLAFTLKATMGAL
jgi:hypothetical protein